MIKDVIHNMKRIFMGATVLLFMLPTALKAGMPEINGDATADPKNIAKKKDLPYFNSINLGGVGDLHIKQADQQSLIVEADEKLLPLIKVSVKDKTLYLDMKDASKYTQAKINYYLNINQVETISSSSSASIFIEEGLESNLLNFAISNLGQANIKIKAKKFVARIDGGAKITVQGVADEQDIQITGAGEFEGTKLLGNNATVQVNGNGIVKTHVAKTLSLNLPDQGTVRYCGKPVLTQKVSDTANVTPFEEKFCK